MFAVERRDRIARILNERGRVRTAELAALLGVTEPTIRKDIADLEALGLLVRAHGGAVARGSMAEVDLATRESTFAAEKRRIARACYDLIGDGDAVFIDGGTTQLEVARAVLTEAAAAPTHPRGIKILTNSFAVAELCADLREPPIVLGGRYRPSGACFVGPVTMSTLRQFRIDIAFVGTSGIDDAALYAADVAEAEVKAEAVQRAARTVVPLDHSKVGTTDFVTVCALSLVDTVVTDRPDNQLTHWLDAAGVGLVVAGAPD